mmetsp:Transcript_4500/g.17006  ORF Transcript_4500/g.17006 Transcript_4500/m.17006 type:complete len:285 (+) Transcript_4500:4249-5103(+)
MSVTFENSFVDIRLDVLRVGDFGNVLISYCHFQHIGERGNHRDLCRIVGEEMRVLWHALGESNRVRKGKETIFVCKFVSVGTTFSKRYERRALEKKCDGSVFMRERSRMMILYEGGEDMTLHFPHSLSLQQVRLKFPHKILIVLELIVNLTTESYKSNLLLRFIQNNPHFREIFQFSDCIADVPRVCALLVGLCHIIIFSQGPRARYPNIHHCITHGQRYSQRSVPSFSHVLSHSATEICIVLLNGIFSKRSTKVERCPHGQFWSPVTCANPLKLVSESFLVLV